MRMRLLVVMALGLAALGSLVTGGSRLAAIAAPPAASETPRNTAPLEPGQVDSQRSRVYVHVSKKKLGHEHGVEGRLKSGRIQFDAPRDAGVFEFDMQTFSADGDDAR